MNTFSRTTTVFALAAIVLSALAPGAAADTLYLRDGEQELGTLRQLTEDSVVFEGRDGASKTIPKSQVNQVQLQRARLFDDVETADQITDADLKACIQAQPGDADFPADGTVTLLQRRTFDFTTPGIVKDTNRVITKILRQRGEDAASQLIWFFEDTDDPEIDFALTVTPDGRVHHLSDAAVKNESVYASLPDYRRLAQYRFAAKEPRPGSILDIQYTVARKRDTILEPFYIQEVFRHDAPLLRKEIVVIVPAARIGEVRCVVNAMPDAPIEQAQDEKDGAVRLTFTLAKPQPGILPESLMPPASCFASTVTIGDAAEWPHIVAAYADALDQVPPLSDALKAKAVELAAQGGPQAIHNFIARSIRTLPVPHNQFRIVPHSPEQTARRGMANELDKNFLYCKMLQAAGIGAQFALVRDRNAGSLRQDVPSIRAFDRSAVRLSGDNTFSSVATDLIPYEILPAGLQNTPALLIDTTADPALASTQISTSDQETVSTAFDSTLHPDGALDLTVTFTGAGNTGTWMRGMKSLDQQQLQNQLQQVASSLHHAAVLNDFTTTDLTDLKTTPAITLKMAIPGFAVKAGDLLLFNIPAVIHDASDVGRPTREYDLFWSQIVSETTTGTIKIPQGLTPYAMPQPVAFNSPSVSYSAELKADGQAIHFSDIYRLKVQTAPKDAYTDYKKCHETRAALARQRIILSQP